MRVYSVELLSLRHFLMPGKCKHPSLSCTPNCQLASFRLVLLTETVQLTNEFNLTDAEHEVMIKELHKQLECLTPRSQARRAHVAADEERAHPARGDERVADALQEHPHEGAR